MHSYQQIKIFSQKQKCEFRLYNFTSIAKMKRKLFIHLDFVFIWGGRAGKLLFCPELQCRSSLFQFFEILKILRMHTGPEDTNVFFLWNFRKISGYIWIQYWYIDMWNANILAANQNAERCIGFPQSMPAFGRHWGEETDQ